MLLSGVMRGVRPMKDPREYCKNYVFEGTPVGCKFGNSRDNCPCEMYEARCYNIIVGNACASGHFRCGTMKTIDIWTTSVCPKAERCEERDVVGVAVLRKKKAQQIAAEVIKTAAKPRRRGKRCKTRRGKRVTAVVG